MQKMTVIYVKDEYQHYYRQCSLFECEAHFIHEAIALCRAQEHPLYIRGVVVDDNFFPEFIGYIGFKWR